MKIKKLLSLFLAGIMTVTSLNVSAFAQDGEKFESVAAVSESAEENTVHTAGSLGIALGGAAINQSGNVSDAALPLEPEAAKPHEPVITGASTNNLIYGTEEEAITRAEWLHDLAVVFEMTVEDDNYPDNYFADLTYESEYYHDILLTVDFGVINIEAGQKLFPDEALTRSFAAATLNYCLGFKLDEGAKYNFSESSNALYSNLKDDFQISINRGWFKTIGGAFKPDQTVTLEESKLMLDDAAAVLAVELYVGPEKNDFKFADYVVQMPANVIAEVDDDQVTLRNYGNKSVSNGDTFVFFKNGYPYIYKAVSVKKSANTLIVTIDSAPSSAVISGSTKGDVEVDVDMFEPAEGVTVVKPPKPDASVMADNTKINQKISVSKTLKLGNGISVTVDCDISNVVLHKDIGFIQDTNYVSVTGDVSLKGTAEIDFVELADGQSTITLGRISYGPLYIDVSVTVSLKGGVIVSYTGNFEAGVSLSKSSGFRIIKSFNKQTSSIAVYVKGSLGLKLSAGIEIGSLLKASVYAEVGFKFDMRYTAYGEGKPSSCSNIEAFLYAKIGANAKFDLIFIKKSFSETIDIFTKSNTPCYANFHAEDGERKDSCTRGASSGNSNLYTTSSGSKFGTYCQKGGGSKKWYPGNNGGGYTSFNGSYAAPEVLWEYEVKKDDNNKEYACLTKYNGNAGVVFIPESIDGYAVRELGNSLFANKTSLHSVTVPDSVVTIGNFAFGECENLSSVTLPKKLETLEGSVFYNCKKLTSIFIPKSLSAAYNGDNFKGSGLKHVEFEKGITKIADMLFCVCESLEEITIPQTVTEIGASAFGYTSLKTITIPDSVITIGDFAFGECRELSSVKISQNLETLKGSVFYNCKKLTSIFIPKSLSAAYNGGNFKGSGLKNVEFEQGITKIIDMLFYECSSLEKITIPETVTEIGLCAFEGTSLSSIIIPDSVISIGDSAFANCENLSSVEMSKNLEKLEGSVFYDCKKLASIFIPKSLAYANGSGNFRGSGLKHVEFEQGITKVINTLFYDCDSLEEITIPETVTEIGLSAFNGCTSLVKIVLPSKLETIRDGAFSECSSLKEITIPNSVTKMETSIFYKCSSLETVKMLNSIPEIPNNTFRDCTSLKNIEIPKTVEKIYSDAFLNCTSLTKLTLPEGLEELGESAFENCNGLTKITIPDSVTAIWQRVFYDCDGLTEITIPNNVTVLGDRTFYDCDSLKKVVISDSVESIGSNAFYSCDVLSNVDMGKGVETIGNSAFRLCPELTSISVSANVSSIGEYVFAENTKLKDITIYPGVTSISDNSFSYYNLNIHGVKGSYAETFANERDKTTFIPIDTISADMLTVKFLDNSNRYSVNPAYTWTGSKMKPALKVFLGCYELTEGTDYTVLSYSNNAEVGTASAEIQCKGLYSGKTKGIFTIEGISIDRVWVTYDRSFDYTGSPITPSVTVEYDGKKLVKGTDYTVSYKNNTEAGEASIIIKGIGHFKGEREYTFTILPLVICTKAEDMQSAHPYGNNEDTTYFYKSEGASSISITFSEDTFFEEDCDYLVIIDFEGNETRYTGDELRGKTITVNGDSVKLKLVSDNSGAEYGFRVTKIEVDKTGEREFEDKETGITVSGNNAFSDDAVLKVDVVDSGANKDKAVYNIYFENSDGEKIQPEGEVIVTIPLPAGWNENTYKVYRREADGSYTDMKAEYKNGCMVFVTEHFSEYVISVNKPSAVLLGDVNGDGKITTVDAKWVLQAVSGSRTLTPEQIAAADVNGDGKITTVDAKWILQAVSGSRELSGRSKTQVKKCVKHIY